MIIPNNGKVVIIDDQVSEVTNLMKALSKNHVPFSYFQDENGDDLPEEGQYLKNVRLIFLDIVLDTGIDQTEKSLISNVLSRLNRIIGDDNGPYFIFLWSTQYESYGKALIEEINTKPLFEKRRPIGFIELKKKELQEKGFEAISNALNSEIKKFDSLNAFFYWESIINDSAGEITNELISLIPINPDWNHGTKNILYKLSSAHWGLSINNILESRKKVSGAYSTLNHVLSDKIDINTYKHYTDILNDILVANGEDCQELFAKINEKIHVDNTPDKNVLVPGSVIFCIEELKKEVERVNRDFEKEVNRLTERNRTTPMDNLEKIITNKRSKKEECINIQKGFITEKNKTLNTIINDSLGRLKSGKIISDTYRARICESSKYIEVNITPRCDFAQNKVKNHRFLPGALVLEKYISKLNKNAEYNYISDFKIHYNGSVYIFLFDFRHFYSLKDKELPINLSPIFRIKENFLNELQVKLSGHISRLGLLYMS